MDKEKALIAAFKAMTDNDIVSLWNEYCRENYNNEDIIRENTDNNIDDFFDGMEASKILGSVSKDYKNYENYFRDTIYGIESFNCPTDKMDFDDLADGIIRSPEIVSEACLVEELAELLLDVFESQLEDDGYTHETDIDDIIDTESLVNDDWGDIVADLIDSGELEKE